MGDELKVPLGKTAFVSGRTMFELLPRDYPYYYDPICYSEYHRNALDSCSTTFLGA
ncbi:hypothetical protein P691DRAFT_307052 [Macrolepiota fuliginosa MF-IS2]|uniref:Uncharacterized protein n=1 Tax=Macrolepiota fuliginosa MF-IS2 TaxID=1400762 RepID=A0A9P5X4M5_9AGAR|nr:hypothetical protein P691DRAFT_307052 [Macrolepiota fuliginosa MF-IS2]